MKHIKSYENIKDIKEIKKYVIWKDEEETYSEIIEITNISRDGEYWSRLIYKYDNDKLELIDDNPKNRAFFTKSDIKDGYVKFTSNDLQECIDIIPIIMNANKYNL